MANSQLTAFIQSQILSSQRSPTRSAPPLQRCLRVKKVASESLAGHVGVSPGDLLVSLNGHAAGSLDPKLYRAPARQRTYLFFRGKRRNGWTATRRRQSRSCSKSYQDSSFDRFAEALVSLGQEKPGACAAGAPFEVLLDPEGALGGAVRAPGSPYVVALDSHATVLTERDMDGVDLWRALEKANQG